MRVVMASSSIGAGRRSNAGITAPRASSLRSPKPRRICQRS